VTEQDEISKKNDNKIFSAFALFFTLQQRERHGRKKKQHLLWDAGSKHCGCGHFSTSAIECCAQAVFSWLEHAPQILS